MAVDGYNLIPGVIDTMMKDTFRKTLKSSVFCVNQLYPDVDSVDISYRTVSFKAFKATSELQDALSHIESLGEEVYVSSDITMGLSACSMILGGVFCAIYDRRDYDNLEDQQKLFTFKDIEVAQSMLNQINRYLESDRKLMEIDHVC